MSSIEPAIFKQILPLTLEVVCPRCISSNRVRMDEEYVNYDCPKGCGMTFWFSLTVYARVP